MRAIHELKRSTERRVVFLFGISFPLLFPLWFSYISYKLRLPGDCKKPTSLYTTQLHVDPEISHRNGPIIHVYETVNEVSGLVSNLF